MDFKSEEDFLFLRSYFENGIVEVGEKVIFFVIVGFYSCMSFLWLNFFLFSGYRKFLE